VSIKKLPAEVELLVETFQAVVESVVTSNVMLESVLGREEVEEMYANPGL
jgi:hypothetical protein